MDYACRMALKQSFRAKAFRCARDFSSAKMDGSPSGSERISSVKFHKVYLAALLLFLMSPLTAANGQTAPPALPEPPLGAGILVANSCSSLAGCSTHFTGSSSPIVTTLSVAPNPSTGICSGGLFSGLATLTDTAGYSSNTEVQCDGDGYAYQNSWQTFYYGTDAWTKSSAQTSSQPLTITVPANALNPTQGFTAYALYRHDNRGSSVNDVILSWKTGSSGLAALVYDGQHFRLDTAINGSAIPYSQYFWDPDANSLANFPTDTAPSQTISGPFSRLSDIHTETGCYGDICVYHPVYYTWYHLFVTVTPDGRVRLDVYNYNPANRSAGRSFDWNESVLEGGSLLTYLPPRATGSSPTKVFSNNWAGQSTVFELLTNDFGSSWYSYISNYTTPALNMATIFNRPLSYGEQLTYFNQQMARNLNGSTRAQSDATSMITDTDIGGGMGYLSYLYPCNTGRFLVRPTSDYPNPVRISTPCGLHVSPFEEPLQASGNPTVAQISLSPTKIAFSPAAVGTTSSQTVTVTNTSAVSVTVTGINLNNIVGLGNSLTLSNTCSTALAPGGTCTILVGYTGSFEAVSASIGATATLSTNTTATATSSTDTTTSSAASYYHIDVTGQVTPPILVTSATALGLMSNGIGSQYFGAATFSITNASTASPLTVAASTITGPNAANFTVDRSRCVAPIAPAASCNVTVNYINPTSSQAVATLTIFSDDPNSPDTVALTGTGSPVNISQQSLLFETTGIGVQMTLYETVYNTSSNPVSIAAPSILQGSSSAFVISKNTCGSLAPNTGCTIGIIYTSPSSTPSSGLLSITNSNSSSPQFVSLEGNVLPPTFSVDPLSTSFSWGGQALFQLTNATSGPITVAYGIAEHRTELFSVGSLTCTISQTDDRHGTFTVSGNASCHFVVQFDPVTGKENGSVLLTLIEPGTKQPVLVNLSFKGTKLALTGGLIVSANTLPFSEEGSRALSLFNAGDTPATISTNISGNDALDFSESDNCNGTNGTLAAGASCIMYVTYADVDRTEPDQVFSLLQIVSNAASSPISVQLEGPRNRPNVGVSVFSSTLTFGEEGVQALTISNLGGITATIGTQISGNDGIDFSESDTCGILAPGAACTMYVTYANVDGADPQQLYGLLQIISDVNSSPIPVQLEGQQ